MKVISIIILTFTLAVSCKTVKTNTAIVNQTDTVQFTFLYSEGLKYEMLGNTELSKELFKKCLSISKGSSASAYELADLYLKESKLDSARIFSEYCLNIVPNNEWYLLQRATIAQGQNDITRYNSIYSRLASLFPENLDYNFELAIILYKKKKYDEALKILDNIEETVGVNEDVSNLKNQIFFEQKSFDSLQAELLKLKVFFPDSVKYMDQLAEFYLNTNQSDKAFSLYNNILNVDKENIYAKYGLAILYSKVSMFSKGYDYLKDVLDTDILDIGKKESVSQSYLNSPENSLTREDINFIYQKLIDDKNIGIDIINGYLAFLFKSKDLTKTEIIAKYSIKNKPENFWGWDYLFNVFIVQSRYEEMNSFALKAIEFFPNNGQIYFYTGYSYFILRKFNEAIKYFETGLDYAVDNMNLQLQFILYLAESYHSIGKHAKSDSYFDLYLKKDSSNSALMNNYAFYLVSRSVSLDKAASLSMKSIEREPFNSTFLDTYSWIMYAKGNYDEALNYIERSYRYGGIKNYIILEHYGDILLKLGKIPDAIQKWEEALTISKSNKSLIEKIEKYKTED